MAALLSVTQDDRFLLIRSHYRQEVFGPIGGVFKYYPTARNALDLYGFSPQRRPGDFGEDLRSDLRGFIPGRSMPNFLRWFVSGKQREVEPLTREIREELDEIGLRHYESREPYKFDLIRTIYEGPTGVPGEAYLQFRFLQIYRLDYSCETGRSLTEHLFSQASQNPNLIAVTSAEIRRRRANSGEFIGEHSAYLIGDRRTGIEPAPFT